MKIIQERKKYFGVEYEFVYVLPNHTEISFPCDDDGNIDYDSLTHHQKIRYDALAVGKYKYIDRFIEDIEIVDIQAAVGKCSCGNHVTLYSFLNICSKCRKEYSIKGEELPPY